MRKSTEEIENEMKRAKTWDDLKEIMKKNGIGKETFGDRLLELCTKYEVRPADLERKVAISKSQFYAVMNGTRNIKFGIEHKKDIYEINEMLIEYGSKINLAY